MLVVAPGWGIGSHYLQHGLAPLAVRFTLIFVDPRGSGRSGRPADNAAMTSAVMAEDIYALTQHLKLAPVDLIAHSNGGAIALAFAANHPEACGKLALVDSQLTGFDAHEATGKIVASAKDDPRYRSAVGKLGLSLPQADDAFTAHLKDLLPLYFHHPQQMLPRFLQTMDGLLSAETFHAQSAADRAGGHQSDRGAWQYPRKLTGNGWPARLDLPASGVRAHPFRIVVVDARDLRIFRSFPVD